MLRVVACQKYSSFSTKSIFLAAPALAGAAVISQVLLTQKAVLATFTFMLAIFLDTETNGLNPQKHKILEIAYKILDAETGEQKLEFHAVVHQPEDAWKQSDPASLKINGFTWDEIQQGEKTELVAQNIKTQFAELGIRRGNTVFVCQNPSFDRVFFGQLINPDEQEALLWPYHWLDLASMYWKESMRLGKENPKAYPWNTGYSKDKIAAACGLPPEKSPHRAMNGVDHLIQCYKAVVSFPKS